MVHREYRRLANTPEEAERLARRACPHCGCERENFKPRNRNATCCQPSCSDAYWNEQRPTIAAMRQSLLKTQGGKCASCKQDVHYDWRHPYVLDHIRPIAMGGNQWDRENLQVLCERCNKDKTARDMGRIARWKKYHAKGIEVKEDRTRQARITED